MITALILIGLAQAPCFTASDASPGWKQVTLSEELRGLAAPEGIEQFRPEQPVTITESRSGLYLLGIDDGVGVSAFGFKLEEGARSVEVRFTQPLRGAKVDVDAEGEFGRMSLLREERVGGTTLPLLWGMREVKKVVVRVHQHLRKTPIVDGFTSVRSVRIEQLGVSAAFRLKGSLYYLQPVGEPVPLCVAPTRTMGVRPGSPGREDEPTPVLLKSK